MTEMMGEYVCNQILEIIQNRTLIIHTSNYILQTHYLKSS